MNDGVEVRSYLHWSMLDNWEWGQWGPPSAWVAVNRTSFQRTRKPSLNWFGSRAQGRAAV